MSMHAVVMHETGGPEVLRHEEIAAPEPRDGEVLIRVRAASVNAIDWKHRRGRADKKLPAVLGSDVSGIVEVSGAEAFAPGDEVFGFARGGAYAELATAAANRIAQKPPGVSHEQAAALPVAGLTAWQVLFDHAGLQSGQTVAVAGAAGGVGHLAIQLARHAGASPIGIGSSRNRDFVLGLGADDYVDYARQDVATAIQDADVAFDAVGGETTEQLLATLRPGGVLVTIANAAPEDAARGRGVRAERAVMKPDAGQLGRIARLLADGDIRVEIAESLPIAEVRRAHELIESGHTRGKLVVTF
jgi:NADPH:quinone reductase-like Zn-dependent oxidoreductase